MKKYKLTNQNLQTYNGYQWVIGEERTTNGTGSLCSKGWFHYYHHPLLAILLNPAHADISNPRLFECKALGKHLNDKGLKGGCTKMTLVKELPVPDITSVQRIAFGILCVLETYKDPEYIKWATNWLNNIDRTASTAVHIVLATNDAASAAASAAAYATNAAASAAASAAAYATYAAASAAAYAAAYAATYAAASAAAYAATYATNAAKINLIKLAKEALKYK